jgi:hypothetical protein
LQGYQPSFELSDVDYESGEQNESIMTNPMVSEEERDMYMSILSGRTEEPENLLN